MTTTWTAVEERIAWTATEDPSYQFVTLRPTTVTLESGGDGGGAVDSVNGATGTVVLDAGDVGADPAGTAAGLVDDLSGVTNAATARSNLGLGNVDNTSDANKPVSSAQQTALDGKAAASHSHSGADITSGLVAPSVLGTGAANNTTFLRGDGTWTAPASSLPGWYTDLAYSPLMGTAHCQIGGGGAVTIAFGADTLIMWRIMAVETVDIDGVTVMTQTAGGAGQQARFGIYSADVNGVPSGAAVVDSGAMSVSSAATLLTSTFTAVRLQPYRPMWAAMLTSSAAVTFRFLASAAANNTPGQMLDTGIFNTFNNQIRRATGVTFGALPTAPSMPFTGSTNIIPGVFWRTRRV